ncbi:FAD binding domain-containing protein [Candidatus Palauibacter sp.]|uniref:FAD binding domain-containing protein n=1 Tax=Candidatus Palauibacter sp. TaxID=3101350 RepID=UPI003C6EE5D6
MIPPQFDYHAPGGLDEALGLLGELDDAKVMSGGQSLLPMMKLRLAAPAHIIDISRIPGLDTIEERDGCLRIGTLVTESQLDRSPVVAARYPILVDTARVIADPLVRNRATVCGNLAHGDPANDHPATMLALRAHVVATGPGGERTIDIDDFFHGLFMTALGEDEILTEIHVPVPTARSGGAYVKLERKVGDYAVAGAAVQLSLADDGTVARAGVGLTNLGFAPIRASAAEDALTGSAAGDEDAIAAAAQAAADAADPVADRRGSVEYKKNMARVLTARAIRTALARAGG